MVEGKRVGIIIQARINSERLPGKVLLPLPHSSSVSLLEQILKRAKCVACADEVVVAIPESKENNGIEEVAKSSNAGVFRGSEYDVLQRYYQASTLYNLDVIVRLTADNPFIDFKIIEDVVREHVAQDVDYTTTMGLPLGCNVEVISYNALKKAMSDAKDRSDKEHVTLYIRNNPKLFNLYTKFYDSDNFGSKDWRFTVDSESDYALACCIYKELDNSDIIFSLSDIASCINKNPWMLLINKNIEQKKVYHTEEDELKASIQYLDKQELNKASAILKNYLNNHIKR